jgi:hypothetical protein
LHADRNRRILILQGEFYLMSKVYKCGEVITKTWERAVLRGGNEKGRQKPAFFI